MRISVVVLQITSCGYRSLFEITLCLQKPGTHSWHNPLKHLPKDSKKCHKLLLRDENLKKPGHKNSTADLMHPVPDLIMTE